MGRRPGPGGDTGGTEALPFECLLESPFESRFESLLRRLRSEQTESAQFLVSENHLLAVAALFQVTDPRQMREPAKLRGGDAQQYRRLVFFHSILKVHVHGARSFLEV